LGQQWLAKLTRQRSKCLLPASIAGYALQLNASHYVVIMLDKVDEVFASEARNAFIR
jgi:hypothetical protein